MTCFGFFKIWQQQQRLYSRFVLAVLAGGFVNTMGLSQVAHAQSAMGAYCQLSQEAIAQTDALRQAALTGDEEAERNYKTWIGQQAEQLHQCRNRTWPQTQAIWIRLYPCDAQPGALDELFDRIISRGYNQIYVEVFHDGQVLLPANDNPTAWASIIRSAGYEDTDLLKEAIAKGRERGLKVYAWLFTMNFGYSYSLRQEAAQALALNGRGETSLTALAASESGTVNTNEIFIDPYSPQARQDYQTLIQAVLKRQPDGVLFDYIRYPLGHGGESVASRVQDLWIYGAAAQQALYARAMNKKGLDLIYRYLSQGHISASDIAAANAAHPNEGVPLWQGRDPNSQPTLERLQSELWLLSVAHAVQGVLDFLNLAAQPVRQQSIPAGAVFFPEANQSVGQNGYDSRLQPWDKFPGDMEWHPMAYALCEDSSCVANQVQRVLNFAPDGTSVKPVLAGTWGQTSGGHPPLENQMRAIYQAAPQLTSVSHFAYSWQEAEHDRDRKFCRL